MSNKDNKKRGWYSAQPGDSYIFFTQYQPQKFARQSPWRVNGMYIYIYVAFPVPGASQASAATNQLHWLCTQTYNYDHVYTHTSMWGYLSAEGPGDVRAGHIWDRGEVGLFRDKWWEIEQTESVLCSCLRVNVYESMSLQMLVRIRDVPGINLGCTHTHTHIRDKKA